MTTRRRLVLALGAGALGVPLLALGQQQKVRRIGYLANDAEPRKSSPTFQALMAGLHELGWIEGRNIELHIRSSSGRIELFPQLASEIVSAKVDVIVTGGSAATRAAQAATGTIPIVFASAADPVGQKLVASPVRPGANVTGFELVLKDLGSKRLELLKEMLPRITRVTRVYAATSIDPLQPAIINDDDSGARRLGVTLQHVAVTDMNSIKAAFAAAAHNREDAIILTGAGLFVGNREIIATLALAHRLPTMCTDARFADAGALVSYGENLLLRYRRVARTVDKILRGGSPANIPVDHHMDFELVLNLKTAQALGITVPGPFLLRANRVIK